MQYTYFLCLNDKGKRIEDWIEEQFLPCCLGGWGHRKSMGGVQDSGSIH